MRRQLSLIAAIAAVSVSFGLIAFYQAADGQEGDPQPGGKTTVKVPMRDGTLLATDVHLPPGPGPWPTIVVRTPYGRQGVPGALGAGAGFAVVVQDFRGRFDSDGECLVFHDDGWGERQDGYDCIEWTSRQPWCNGKIGTWGGSALGITQYSTAPTQPPGLAAQHITVGTPDLYHHATYAGGVFRQALVGDWLEQNRFPEAVLEAMIGHPAFDDWWRVFCLGPDEYARVSVPACHIGGWYDIFSQGTIDGFVGYQTLGAEGARGRQKLVMGPWTHGVGASTRIGELEFPPNSKQLPPHTDLVRWLNAWLKGEDNGVADAPAVTYYVMGDVDDPDAPGNEWRTADAWPIPSTLTSYYLHGEGLLSATEPADAEPLAYAYDPANPVPTVGGGNLTIAAGPYDQRKVESRPDVLVFSSEPLEEPIEITGRVRVELFAATSAPDTDFTAKLCDVYPDGRSMLLLDGVIRGRWRNAGLEPEPMEPGRAYKLYIDLWSTSVVINRGHRIRIDISSSNAPRFEANPNTGGPLVPGEPGQVAQNTVYLDAEHPSRIILPVVR